MTVLSRLFPDPTAVSSSSSVLVWDKPLPKTSGMIKPKPIREIYPYKPLQRMISDFRTELSLVGGACTVAYKAYCAFSGRAVGIVIAANNGLPGGALGERECVVNESDLLHRTQEESVWAAAVLANCGLDIQAQKKFYYETIFKKWGLVDSDTCCMTRQGVNYVETTDAEEYSRAYVQKDVKLINVVSSPNGLKKVESGTEFPAAFVFVGGPNTNDGWDTANSPQSRTKNAKATSDYEFFKACQTCAVRAAVDRAAEEGIEVLVMAPISTGINANAHATSRAIFSDFHTILTNVLNEPVGIAGERRGQYFVDIVLPEVDAGRYQRLCPTQQSAAATSSQFIFSE